MVVVDDATRESTTKTRDDEEKTARDKCGVFLAVAIIFLGTTRGGEKVVTEEKTRRRRFGDANDAEKAAKTRATVEDKDKIGGKCGLPYDLHAEYAGAVVGTWGENNLVSTPDDCCRASARHGRVQRVRVLRR